jgi:hypothetical protein
MEMTLAEQRKRIEQAQTVEDLNCMLWVAETGELQALICKRAEELIAATIESTGEHVQ